MNQLKVISHNGQLVTESREVAKMTDKTHAHLMRNIQGYKQVLDPNPKLDSADFFIESSYKDSNNQTRPCFLLTKKGCDMVANKMTGEKGILFTAEYVTRFEEMEKQLTSNKPEIDTTQLSPELQMMNQMFQAVAKNELETKEVKRLALQTQNEVNNISNIVSMNSDEWRSTTDVVLKKIAAKWTGVEPYRSVRNLSYERFEKKAKCKLELRLNNRKERALAQGMSKTYINKINKLDCISEDKRLVEIYIQVVKEMAIQFKVDISDLKDVI
ncbi:Rha family transcriptional regulator [Oceanobacillus sp. J11TS1]|uniref:Rha family transcriptional regulator n=1 Tax=Oceanobacillus sp. J11TS1 TaxID=2807191 RepID=UPI001B141BA5|nr:Rha family transcriptional regulator [Oceanobacillus sp. J11TS1]GIO23929.1 hypothetical protein J11TS1_25100 [Oceanobacillus sp. J11TS1]